MAKSSAERPRLEDPATAFVPELLGWYDRVARDLPWRQTRDPYAIWVSEAMLQQTRVETVVPYWRRFLELFPTFEALARAAEDDVLAAWSGLGYYRRARSLAAAARAVCELHGGRFPQEREAALALPGVGAYTAGAVLSIAFDQPEPVVDGNVTRVFARWFEWDDPIGSGPLTRASWERAAQLVPARRAGAWNQALMELGATVCRPRDPACDRCPVEKHCQARAAGRQAELPVPKPRPEPIDVEATSYVLARDGRLLLERRPNEGRMAGMWQLPTVETSSSKGAEPLLFPASLPDGLTGGLTLRGAELGRLRHGITRHRITVRVIGAAWRPGASVPGGFAWHELGRIDDLPRTGITKKALRASFVTRWLAGR